MSANGEAMSQNSTEMADTGKGKGKAVEQPDMIEEDDESEDESVAEEPLEPEEEDDEDMEEIDPNNIVQGRTRRKQIDWAEAEQKSKDAGDDLDDDDDDDDEDFEAEDDDEEMKG
ncbi:uncharacterized protein Z518_00017 [Rhinocladiella mackenziei CBS 650.93]|uniref:Histone chaperone domain-containing protein n=1 Tax=Rhinocladiella mackenziei CBS 650.93 TaxID=1442369 RepID=A0A0D2ISH9_9EURO|nr:uncharacterized protein Z518_00017 [Rhinocladiella mackenziei CBS 650.93]KIX08939.1 hypothetical protein Z518_00017 [Rhinocladiella mackenziei CBS 650.93]